MTILSTPDMNDLIQRDLKHHWHPCSQMKDYLDFPSLIIKRAKGSYITLNTGQKLIDAISSWWCKNLGHQHPALIKTLKRQLSHYEHVISANTYQKPLIELSEKLAQLSSLKKVFFASDGSTAVEIALKMSLHIRYVEGNQSRTNMLALGNGYHGESLFAMSVSDVELYRKPYERLLPKVHFLKSIPYVTSKTDPLFFDCSHLWAPFEKELRPLADRLSLIIVEPIVQATGGMKIYSANFLHRLSTFAKQHQIHFIADEIMTGLGRTGLPLASQYANIEPDFICLSKGLTAGFLPMSCVLLQDNIYNACFNDYAEGKSFLHSNTFSGNALAAAVAFTHLHLLEEHNIYDYVQNILAPLMREYMEDVQETTKQIHSVRSIGAIAAASLVTENLGNKNSRSMPIRYGYEVYKSAVKYGALLRPLGNTLYWTPPLNTTPKTLKKLRDITIKAIRSVQNE